MCFLRLASQLRVDLLKQSSTKVAANLFADGPHRIVREMSVPLGRGGVSVAKQLADNRKGSPFARSDAREGVAHVVYSDVLQSSAASNLSSRLSSIP